MAKRTEGCFVWIYFYYRQQMSGVIAELFCRFKPTVLLNVIFSVRIQNFNLELSSFLS